MTTPFLSCDWGTSSFRLRLISPGDLGILAEVQTPDGVKGIHARLLERGVAGDPAARTQAFSDVLASGIAGLVPAPSSSGAGAPVVISGMASSTIGWRNLPYAATPCPLDGSTLLSGEVGPVSVRGTMHRVRLISGLSTGEDLMRGEESELVGLLAVPGFEALRKACMVLLPGTHAKHVQVGGGAIVKFRTHLTGELLELLSTHSVLGVSVQWPPPMVSDAPGEAAAAADFLAGVDLARRVGLGPGLFQVRVRSVLQQVPAAANARFLAGLLIGSEVLDLLAGSGDVPLLLASPPAAGAAYALAVRALGGGSRLVRVPGETFRSATVRTHALLLARLAGT